MALPESIEADTQPRRLRAGKPLALSGIITACLLFFSLTSPKAIPSSMLVLGFVVLGLMVFACLKLGLQLTGLQQRLTRVQRRVVLVGGTALPLMLLMLQSIGQLTVRDILTLCGLFLMGLFYISRVAGGRL